MVSCVTTALEFEVKKPEAEQTNNFKSFKVGLCIIAILLHDKRLKAEMPFLFAVYLDGVKVAGFFSIHVAIFQK